MPRQKGWTSCLSASAARPCPHFTARNRARSKLASGSKPALARSSMEANRSSCFSRSSTPQVMRSSSCRRRCNWAERSRRNGQPRSSFQLTISGSVPAVWAPGHAPMVWSSSSGPRSSRRMRLSFYRWPNRARSTSPPWPRSALASARFEEDPHMEPEKTTRISKPEEEPEHMEAELEATAPAEIEEPPATGFGARLRQLVEQAKQDSRPNIKREQLKQNRTKSFLMLAGSMVVMALLFFAMFSSPANNRRNNTTHPNTPNLGRGPGNGNASNDGRSITPLLAADTRNPNDEPGGVTPEDIHNTA